MTRARAALRRAAFVAAAPVGRMVRLLPAAAAMGCDVAGVWLLFGLGWALLAAVPFLLLIDAKMPRVG